MLTKEERVLRKRVPSPRSARAGLGHSPRLLREALCVAGLIAAGLAGCGGGTPVGNPPDIQNGQNTAGGRALSFAYFQRCINPIFLAPLPIIGTSAINTCAGAGCHDDANGTGGAFRVRPAATPLDLTNPANTPDVIRASDMYKNFFSAQGEVTFNSVLLSRLVTKPLVQGVLHGGGQIFPNSSDANVRLILYWMTNPVPVGQDEFSSDPGAGLCPS